MSGAGVSITGRVSISGVLASGTALASNRDPLDDVACHLPMAAVVKPSRAWVGVAGEQLHVFERPAKRHLRYRSTRPWTNPLGLASPPCWSWRNGANNVTAMLMEEKNANPRRPRKVA